MKEDTYAFNLYRYILFNLIYRRWDLDSTARFETATFSITVTVFITILLEDCYDREHKRYSLLNFKYMHIIDAIK